MTCESGEHPQLALRYHTSEVIVRSEVECCVVCFLVGNSEVSQVTSSGDGGGVIECSCSSVPARYLLTFPQRYLQCINNSQSTGSNFNSIEQDQPNSIHWIFYRSDRLWSNWSAVSAVNGSMPLLFYALDDVSGTSNLGSLGSEDRYSAQWMNGTGYFDCDWDDATSNRPKLLRLVSAEKPWLSVVHNLTVYVSAGFTAMIWFKKNDPAAFNLPLFVGLSGGSIVWQMFNFLADDQIFVNFASTVLFTSNVLNTLSWNNVALQISTNQTMFVNVNGTFVSAQTATPNPTVFGDQLSIGRRVVPTSPANDVVWDGCLGHVMLFNRTLSTEEAELWSSLVSDDTF